jgi:hypothetical protein
VVEGMSENNVWQSQVSQEMIDTSGLNDNEISLLINALDDAVAEICESYGIE